MQIVLMIYITINMEKTNKQKQKHRMAKVTYTKLALWVQNKLLYSLLIHYLLVPSSEMHLKVER